ncbi:MAG: hypothetical protein ACK59G_03945 [Cyanobacteriota bacterium]
MNSDQWRGDEAAMSKGWGVALALLVVPAWLALRPLQALAQPQAPAAHSAESPAAPSPPAPGSQPAPEVEEEAPGDMPPPPPDLVILVDKVGVNGRYRLGVFGRKPNASQPQVWRLNLWEQTLDRLFISTDVLDCSPTQPLRITGGSGTGNGRLILRELNPGGAITSANRLDHQIWWAACFPEHAGKDPATLAAEARRLGYSGTLVEREQVVPGARRP